MGRSISKTVSVTARVDTEVDVEVDIDDVLNECLDDVADEALRQFGLTRVICMDQSVSDAWHRVARAMRRGDRNEVANTLSALAWDQAGVVLPAI